MALRYQIIFGDAQHIPELSDESVHLVITSPPYFNAPFDYPDLFPSYDAYLQMTEKVAQELFRVLALGRLLALLFGQNLNPPDLYRFIFACGSEEITFGVESQS